MGRKGMGEEEIDRMKMIDILWWGWEKENAGDEEMQMIEHIEHVV